LRENYHKKQLQIVIEVNLFHIKKLNTTAPMVYNVRHYQTHRNTIIEVGKSQYS